MKRVDLANASPIIMSELSDAIIRSKRCVVVTGAGVSCSAGIPDFRSSDGLYNLVKDKYPDTFLKGRELFDASLFRDPDSTALFYTFLAELRRAIHKVEGATPTHDFFKTLKDKGKLLRVYTQNIDGLESRTGLEIVDLRSKKSKGDVVQLHGNLEKVRCCICCRAFEHTEVYGNSFGEGKAPDCPACYERCNERKKNGKRSLKIGTLRPDIVLYNETHGQGEVIGDMQARDLSRRPDLLLIMGTSLKVHGLRRTVKEFAKAVHATRVVARNVSGETFGKVILINKTDVASTKEWEGVIDYHVAGETDVWVESFMKIWKSRRAGLFETQTTLTNKYKVKKGDKEKTLANKCKVKKGDKENIETLEKGGVVKTMEKARSVAKGLSDKAGVVKRAASPTNSAAGKSLYKSPVKAAEIKIFEDAETETVVV